MDWLELSKWEFILRNHKDSSIMQGYAHQIFPDSTSMHCMYVESVQSTNHSAGGDITKETLPDVLSRKLISY